MKRKLKPVYKKMATGGPGPVTGSYGTGLTLQHMLEKLGRGPVSLDRTSTPSAADLAVGSVRPTPGSAAAASTQPVSGSSTRRNVFDVAGNIAKDVKPFISNIANSFSRPPRPSVPESIKPVVLPKISLEASRIASSRKFRGADLAATRSLDEQSAAAVRGANRAQELSNLNEINEAEANANAQQATRAASINANIDATNVGARNQFRDNITNRTIARKREQSANLANASDKMIMIDNERSKGKLELEKMRMLSKMYAQSGVWDRKIDEKRIGINGRGENEFAFGGSLGEDPLVPVKPTPGRPVFTSQAEIDAANAAAKNMAVRKGLISGEDTYVARNIGDPKPFVVADGRAAGAIKPKLFNIPNYITRDDIQTHEGSAWYTDPRTGDIQDIDMSVLNQPRFMNTEAKKAQDAANLAARAVAVKRMKMGGKLKKVY
jgi:hypothetical protein